MVTKNSINLAIKIDELLIRRERKIYIRAEMLSLQYGDEEFHKHSHGN
jgi:hypothetical protein